MDWSVLICNQRDASSRCFRYWLIRHIFVFIFLAMVAVVSYNYGPVGLTLLAIVATIFYGIYVALGSLVHELMQNHPEAWLNIFGII
jgi:hypothetical protein